MATLTVQQVTLTGVTPTFVAAAAGGDVLTNDGNTVIYVKNGGGSPITVTVTTPASILGVAIADPQVSVTNGSEKVIGPFPPEIFNDANGQVALAYSAVTSVTIAVVKVKP